MCDLVARTGRLQQRYESGCRLVAGCIPYKYRNSDGNSDENSEKIVEVLMINSTSGPGLLFPKGGWENDETVEEAAAREALEEAGVRGDIMEYLGCYHFKSKTHQDEISPEGLCKAAMFALFVTEELESWPEQSTRMRRWLTIPEAADSCRHAWMREVLEESFCKWHADKMVSLREEEPNHPDAPSSPKVAEQDPPKDEEQQDQPDVPATPRYEDYLDAESSPRDGEEDDPKDE